MTAPALNVNRLINVTVNLTPTPVAGRTFNILMSAGDSNVINGVDRFRTYSDAEGVVADFGVTAPESIAAELYFGQSPQPSTLMVGRWLRVATAGFNIGGALAPSAQLLANWTAITSGGFSITIDGVAQNLTALNFSGATSLNGVASVITAGLTGGATCVWTGTQFEIISGSTGAGAYATGTYTFTGNPANNNHHHTQRDGHHVCHRNPDKRPSENRRLKRCNSCCPLDVPSSIRRHATCQVYLLDSRQRSYRNFQNPRHDRQLIHHGQNVDQHHGRRRDSSWWFGCIIRRLRNFARIGHRHFDHAQPHGGAQPSTHSGLCG